MATTKIRRCLFVGLGGTGMTSLLHTKKAFIETYGEVPPMIAFLGVDTDGAAFTKSISSARGPVTLLPSEQYSRVISTPEDTFRNNRNRFSWMPEGNSGALASLKGRGAGQKRSSGRFWIVNQMSGTAGLEAMIRQAVSRVTSASINDDTRYSLLSDEVEVHMVFSLCGGTGAGTFIDMAYLLRRLLGRRTKIAAYAVLPDVFVNMSPYGMDNVRPNAYGCILDLDYLMRMSPESKPIAVEYLDKTVEFTERPVNAIFLIDNKNQNGDSFNHVDQLAEMISMALITAAGQLSDAAASTLDNIDVTINEANSREGANIAWVSTMGASEIVLHPTTLARIYAIKGARYLIHSLLHSDADANNLANAWIDDPAVNIRENNGPQNDNVIDYLLQAQPEHPLEEIEDDDNAMPEVQQYIQLATPKAEEIAQKRQAKTAEVNAQLDALVKRNLVTQGGVGKTRDILKEIRYQVESLFLKEMKDELDELQKREQRHDQDIITQVQELQNKSMFALPPKRRRLRAAVVEAANEGALVARELLRRQQAIIFFTGLIAEIDRHLETLDNIVTKLKAVNSQLENEVMQLQNASAGSEAGANTFCIDLTGSVAVTVSINQDEVTVDEFIQGGNSILAFAQMSQAEVEKSLLDFAASLKGAKALEGKSVNDVLDTLKAERPDVLHSLIERAMKKARPLLAFDDRGYPNESSTISDLCFVGVADKAHNAVSSELATIRDSNARPQVVSTGMSDRVIIYRQQGVAKAFMIGPLLNYENAYQANPDSFHATMEIKNILDKEKWQLMPKGELDDTIELWVRGIIFGLIKREGDTYYYYNRAEGEALDDYMCELGETRVEAYDKFRRKVDAVRNSYVDRIEQYAIEHGADARKQLRADVKANYLGRYSQSELTDNNALKEPRNKALRTLLNREMEFVNSLE